MNQATAVFALAFFAGVVFDGSPRNMASGWGRSSLRVEGNGYVNVLVRVPYGVNPRDPGEFFGQLERVFRRASGELLHASRGLWYFKDIRVLLPPDMKTPRNLLVEGATWELFRDHDIVLVKDDLEVLSTARQSKGCGVHGDSIELPTGALSSTADIDGVSRSLVRAWAQFRFGVFEETPFPAEPQWCFYDGTHWRPTGCYSTDATVRPHRNAEGVLECAKKSLNLKRIFQDANENASSLMFTSSSPKVRQFCDSKTHRSLAPTKHNALCDARSVWTVIEQSLDYSQSLSTNRLTSLPPTLFNYVKPKTHRYIYLVQACAPKPRNGLIYKKVMAAINEGLRRFLLVGRPITSPWRLMLLTGDSSFQQEAEFYPDNDMFQYLGDLYNVVRFDCQNASIEKALLDIKEMTHNEATTVVPLLHSTTLMENNAQLKAVGSIRLSPIIFDMQVSRNNAWRTTLLDTESFIVPTNISQERMTSLVDLALHTIHHRTLDLDHDVRKVFQETDVPLQDGVNGTFSVEDNSEGTLSFIVGCPTIASIDDKDVTFTGGALQTYRIKANIFAGNATKEAGTTTYSYAVRADKSDQRCSFTASLRSPPSKPSIRLNGWFRKRMVNLASGDTPQVLYAELRYEQQAFLNARIQAIVYDTSSVVHEVMLLDNGREPDITESDGVFSAYLTHYSQLSGWYSVVLKAVGPLHTPASSNRIEDTPQRTFTREEFIGSFWTEVASDSGKVAFSPGKVYDLRVTRIQFPEVTLGWTAPGHQEDANIGSIYEIRFSTDRQSLLRNFSQMKGRDVAHTNSTAPPLKSATIQLPSNKGGTPLPVYYVALRVVNKYKLRSQVSNIVTVVLDEPPIEPSATPSAITDDDNDETATSSSSLAPGITQIGSPSSRTIGNGSVIHANDTMRPSPSPTPVARNHTACLYWNQFTEHEFHYILGGAVAGFLLLVVLLNCIICKVCINKAKRRTRIPRSSTNDSNEHSDTRIDGFGDGPPAGVLKSVPNGALRQKLSEMAKERSNPSTVFTEPGSESPSSAPTSPQGRHPKTPGSETVKSGHPAATLEAVTPSSLPVTGPTRRLSREDTDNVQGSGSPPLFLGPPQFVRNASGSQRSSKRSSAFSREASQKSLPSGNCRTSPLHSNRRRTESGNYYDLGFV